MEPFNRYPNKGLKPEGIDLWDPGNNCRWQYGRQLMEKTKQYKCAYCGKDLVSRYRYWLSMSVDHVIPKSTKWRDDWIHDYFNCVICCNTCNGFLSRSRRFYKLLRREPRTLREFIEIRDQIFKLKRQIVKERHEEEYEFWEENHYSWVNTKKRRILE